jgi:hypothetical protein
MYLSDITLKYHFDDEHGLVHFTTLDGKVHSRVYKVKLGLFPCYKVIIRFKNNYYLVR